MSFNYSFPEFIDLHVKDRISKVEADRQTVTAKAILQRLAQQPGLILADEVGMGKTFVALAVAVSVYLKSKEPVVIMIPPNLINKWPNDFRLFCESCVTDSKIQGRLKCAVAKRPEEFLRLLDDDEANRNTIIFLTHGALARNMSDGWIKLAILQRALYRRKDTEELYRSLHRYTGDLVMMGYLQKRNKNVDIWAQILNNGPSRWKKICIKYKVEKEDFDDPVPELFLNELNGVSRQELDSLYWRIKTEMPVRDSSKIKERLQSVREILAEEAKKIWSQCLSKIKMELPMLIFDEAHHLKNSQTQMVTKLFHDPVAEEDAGILNGQFDRMVFLTATPFQLGHHELHSVLERFKTINWKSRNVPLTDQAHYKNELKQLLTQLDDSQIVARKLDTSWGKLQSADLVHSGVLYDNAYDWWKVINNSDTLESALAVKVIDDYRLAKEKLRLVEPLLKKYVIRHLRPREMGDKFTGVPRRSNLPGDAILNAEVSNNYFSTGLGIARDSMLPFLLAARLTSIQPRKRPVFAEGLASSFEAFRYTREENSKKSKVAATDTDDDLVEMDLATDPVADWYLDQLNDALVNSSNNGSSHPKIRPTIDKAIELWNQGEKVLIFCHYIATAKALRKYVSLAMKAHVRKKGAELLLCDENEVFDRLDKIADRITSKDSPLHKKCLSILNELLDEFPSLDSFREKIVDVVIRYMRTPSFLIRFASATEHEINDEWIEKSFSTSDTSGLTLSDMIRGFLNFLSSRREDKVDYINALKSIQTGGVRANDILQEDLGEYESSQENDNIIMANVALCYGETSQERRQKLMKTFNTPFFPDILITSSVMAEGVDLHLNCRHIIHHDLCWNPSTLEQRTGRIDRIGAKAEKCGKSINVYLPYISETQDEKMYKVVTERERWFNIIMGEKYKVDAENTDKYAERVPLPEELSKELSFNLEVKTSH